jgi:hypothetical protein
VGTAVTLASLPVYRYLVHRHGYWGLALASSIGITAFMLVLFVLLNWVMKSRTVRSNIVFFLKITAASATAGYATYLADQRLERHLPWHSMTGAFVLLAIGSSLGLAITVALAKLLRIEEFNAHLNKLSQMIQRRLGRRRSLAARASR